MPWNTRGSRKRWTRNHSQARGGMMTREYLYKLAKLRGFDFDTIKELENFMAPRRRFDGVVDAWRKDLEWRFGL